MGIYDRDYIRRRSDAPRGASPLAGLRMWSVTTWLIVICVAVYVVDGFLPPRPVLMETRLRDDAQGANPKLFQEGQPQAGGPYSFWVPLYAPDVTGRRVQVGERHYLVMRFIESFMHFSTARAIIYFVPGGGIEGFEFWRFIGFQFLHANLMHLFFNMFALWIFGPMVEQRLGGKRYLAFYLLCGICGALMYLLLNLGGFAAAKLLGTDVHVPGLLFNDFSRPLIGASAGVFGVLMAGAYLTPNTVFLLFFILPIRMVTLAYALVAIALITVIMGGNNAGGEAGHLGGAIAGAYFIRHPHHLHGFFDILGRVDPTSHHYRHKEPAGAGTGGAAARPRRDEVDRILDKINESGLHSLTDREKRILREASQRH